MSYTNKADHPRERLVLTVIREPIQPEGLAPIKVLELMAGGHIVYDPALPLGARTAGGVIYPNYSAALEAAWERRRRDGKDPAS